jgi:hypothetical protein
VEITRSKTKVKTRSCYLKDPYKKSYRVQGIFIGVRLYSCQGHKTTTARSYLSSLERVREQHCLAAMKTSILRVLKAIPRPLPVVYSIKIVQEEQN